MWKFNQLGNEIIVDILKWTLQSKFV
jgi:hypothetical protein